MSKRGNATHSPQDDDVFVEPLTKSKEVNTSLLYVTREKTFDLVFCGIRPCKRTHDGRLVFELPQKDFESRLKNDFRIKTGLLVPYKET